ncbi:MAG: 4Fe-4S binding protein [Candidatus Bathyarchaeota archaeon]
MPIVTIDQDACTACQTCIATCPMGVFEAQSDTVVVADAEQCIVCRACEASCPTSAIVVED